MMRLGSLFLAVLMMFTLAACGAQASDAESDHSVPENGEPVESGGVLIAYFSSAGNIAADETVQGNIGKGNTRRVAEWIQGQVGGDLFFIETVSKYSANYQDAIAEAMQELRDNARPELATHVENMSDYDVVFLGYPNWWGTLPQAMLTFIEEYDFSGKTVIPFCTYEDSGLGRSVETLKTMLPNSTHLEAFGVADRDLDEVEETLKQWISGLDLAE